MRKAEASAFRLIKEWIVMVAIVVHVDDMFRVGQKARCDQFGEDLNDMVQVKNLCELRWYCGWFYERVWKKGVLTISQQTFAEQCTDEYM